MQRILSNECPKREKYSGKKQRSMLAGFRELRRAGKCWDFRADFPSTSTQQLPSNPRTANHPMPRILAIELATRGRIQTTPLLIELPQAATRSICSSFFDSDSGAPPIRHRQHHHHPRSAQAARRQHRLRLPPRKHPRPSPRTPRRPPAPPVRSRHQRIPRPARLLARRRNAMFESRSPLRRSHP